MAHVPLMLEYGYAWVSVETDQEQVQTDHSLVETDDVSVDRDSSLFFLAVGQTQQSHSQLAQGLCC